MAGLTVQRDNTAALGPTHSVWNVTVHSACLVCETIFINDPASSFPAGGSACPWRWRQQLLCVHQPRGREAGLEGRAASGAMLGEEGALL